MRRIALLLIPIIVLLLSSHVLPQSLPAAEPPAAEQQAGNSNDKETDEQQPSSAAESKAEESKAEESSSNKDEAKPADQAEAASDEKPATQTPCCPEGQKQAAKSAASSGDKQPSQRTANGRPCVSPPQHKVERGPLKIKVKLDGVFVSRKRSEMRLEPEQWSQFEVKHVLEHGAVVQRGQVLIEFDPEPLDRAIADLERDLELSELAIEVARSEVELRERFTPKDIEVAEREQEQTRDDRHFMLEILLPFRREMAEMALKQAEHVLEYQREELEQLEKMYEADELTEETEEIVLRRARNNVQYAEFFFEQAKLQYDRATEAELPRATIETEESAERTLARLERLQLTLPLQLQEARVKLEQLTIEQQRKREKLDELEADRELMVLKAPIDGVLYYGRGQDGDWDSKQWIEKLRVGQKVSPGGVILSVVQPETMVAAAEVPEKELHDVRKGVRGTVTPVASPQTRLAARVTQVAHVPNGSGKFSARLHVDFGDDAKPLMPGMKCKIELIPYRERKALTVPAQAVFTDDWDEQQRYVYLVTDDKPPKRQNVKIGRQTDKQIEILQGVREGDVILLKCPKKKS